MVNLIHCVALTARWLFITALVYGFQGNMTLAGVFAGVSVSGFIISKIIENRGRNSVSVPLGVVVRSHGANLKQRSWSTTPS